MTSLCPPCKCHVTRYAFFLYCFFFGQQVLTNQSSLNGNVEPSHVFVRTMQSTSCLLILTSQSDAATKTVTQVNVTATPASRSTGVKQFQVFSIIVKVDGSPHTETEDLDIGRRHLKTLYIVLIAIAVFILLITLISAVVYRQKRGSLRPKSCPKVGTCSESSSSQLQLHSKSEEVTVHVEDLEDPS